MSPQVFNTTPFAQQCFLLADPNGQLFFAAVICATFVFNESGEPHPAAEQATVPAGDEPFGDPGRSSLARDSAATSRKLAVDLVLNATAYAPGGKPVSNMLVGVRVGSWSKVLSITGDRRWSRALGNRLSSPIPFASMPIRYERAFGGTLLDQNGGVAGYFPSNPVGVGYKGARSADPDVVTEVPNIELPNSKMSRREDTQLVGGFGVIARNWYPRAGYVGSYDGEWLARRWPLPPLDMDPRFHQCAPPDQQLHDSMAGREVVLRNLTPDALWRFRMPSLDVPIRLVLADSVTDSRIQVDTILIDAEKKQVSLIGRQCFHGLRKLGLVRDVIFGDPTRGWLRARTKNKRYLGNSVP